MSTIRRVNISAGRQGTWETLRLIDQMAAHGLGSPYLERFALSVPLRNWDQTLREYWVYIPEEQETLRGIQVQIRNLLQYNKLMGDCDDASVVVVALLRTLHVPYRIVAIRPPTELEFVHVFVESYIPGGGWMRIDPTSPANADYTGWERMEY